MQFEYGLKKSEGNAEKHGIDFEEAQQLWDDTRMVTGRVECSDEPRWVAFARYAGSVWIAVYTMRGENVRIISVRRATKKEAARYDRENNDR